LPDLILIDGGKGQLSAALRARDESGLSTIPMIGIAKREEEIVIHKALSNIG
jgi:excinuclease ABC subunit C